jgi:tetratricopeptide (TPR) repeat protein
LRDPVRLVRTEAARVLARASGSVPDDQQDALQAALDEYRTGQLADQDQAAAHYNLGNLAHDLGDPREAVARYTAALRQDDRLVTARFNLGLLYSRLGKDELAAEQYRRLLEQLPDSALPEGEIRTLLARASYRLGLMLTRLDRFEEAEQSLLKAHETAPEQFDFLYALGIFYLERREWEKAQERAEQLVLQFPNSPPAKVLLRDVVARRPPVQDDEEGKQENE